MSTAVPGGSKAVNFRLPPWVIAYLASRAQEQRQTKTEVFIEAVTCLRDRELAALMEEGYRDRADEALEFVETTLTVAAETLPQR